VESSQGFVVNFDDMSVFFVNGVTHLLKRL
jgi:hypothetical protein